MSEIDDISLGGYSQYGTLVTNVQPEIVQEIQSLPFEVEVIKNAVDTYYDIVREKYMVTKAKTSDKKCKTIKGNKKKRLIFFCIFWAYIKLERPVDPCYIALIMGMNPKKTEEAITENLGPGVILIDPVKMVPFYINRINSLVGEEGLNFDVENLTEGVTSVINTCRSTKQGEEWMMGQSAKIIAITAIYFYITDIKGINITKSIPLFEKISHLSWACVRRYYDQIVKYYNKENKSHDEEEITSYINFEEEMEKSDDEDISISKSLSGGSDNEGNNIETYNDYEEDVEY